jgi:hypothetical protein
LAFSLFVNGCEDGDELADLVQEVGEVFDRLESFERDLV